MTPKQDPIKAMLCYEATLLGRLDRKLLTNVHVRRILLGLAVVLAIALGVQFVHKSTQETTGVRESLHAAEEARAAEPLPLRTRGAFGRWMFDLRMSRATGKDLYRDFWFPTPPPVAALLTPFSYLPLALGATLWVLLKYAAIASSLWWARASIPPRGASLPSGIFVVGLLIGLRALVSDVQHGNINSFVLLPICGSLYLWTRGRDVSAGLLVALAGVLKVTPALLAVYFLYRRQWRVVAGLLAGCLLFGLLLPILAFGPARAARLYRAWYGVMIEPTMIQGWTTYDLDNQALTGSILRLAGGERAIELERISQEGALRYGSMDLARPVDPFARKIIKLPALLVVLSLAWLCRTKWLGRDDPRLRLEFSLVLVAALLLSERTWKAHGVTLPIVYLSLLYALLCFPWSRQVRAWSGIALLAQFALIALTGESLWGDEMADTLLYNGVLCLALLIAFVQTGWFLRKNWNWPPVPSTAPLHHQPRHQS